MNLSRTSQVKLYQELVNLFPKLLPAQKSKGKFRFKCQGDGRSFDIAAVG